MKTVWKFKLASKIQMPFGAQILSVALHEGKPVIWALVCPVEPLVIRKFNILLTGEEINDSPGRFVGTLLYDEGKYVEHVFDTQQEIRPKDVVGPQHAKDR